MAEKQFREIFLKFLTEDLGCSHDATFLLAVSGGLDSMAMLTLFRDANLKIEIAHVNFGLREYESDEDQKFLESFCRDQQLKLHITCYDTNNYANEHNLSTQMAARELRYDWFENLAKENRLDYICTAHHLNDSLETTFFNLIKGTGISGVAGLLPRRNQIIRPMMVFTRAEILEFASDIGLKWREDSSNQQNKYHRNYIRNKLLPLWEKINPNYINTFRDTSERLRAARSLVEKMGEEIKRKAMRDIQNGWVIDKFPFEEFTSEERKMILSFILDPYGFSYRQVRDIEGSFSHQPGKVFYSEDFELVNDREVLYLVGKSEIQEAIEEKVLDEQTNEFEFSSRIFVVKVIEKADDWRPDYARLCMQFDFDKINFPLKVRTWENGDKFRPLGLKGKKKISDFMIDRKIPVNFKHQVPVVVSGNKIIGLIGHEISDHVKITNQTKKILEFKEIYEKSI